MTTYRNCVECGVRMPCLEHGCVPHQLINCTQCCDTIAWMDKVERAGALTDLLEKIRGEGWMVGVHNDYRLDGERFTFWLFTRHDRECVRGEGRTDLEALEAIQVEILQREADEEMDRQEFIRNCGR